MVADETLRTELLVELGDIAPPEYKKKRKARKPKRRRTKHKPAAAE